MTDASTSVVPPFEVSAPATTANLGPGFDCLGLALDLRNVLRVTPGTGRVTVRGEGAGIVPEDDRNVVARAFDAVAPGLRGNYDLECVNAVPLARGLGSSTAAYAVGAMAGWRVAGANPSLDEVLQVLADADGHADNAAPCTSGGLQVSWRGGAPARWHARELPAPAGLVPVVLVPGRELSTSAARAAIPSTVDHATATRAVGTAAALVAALAAGDLAGAMSLAQDDELHEPHRAHLVPELLAAREALAPLGCPVTLSGAGPTILAWATEANAADVAAALGSIAAADDRTWVLRTSVEGVTRGH